MVTSILSLSLPLSHLTHILLYALQRLLLKKWLAIFGLFQQQHHSIFFNDITRQKKYSELRDVVRFFDQFQ